jgi:hypothetical protein
MINLKQKQLDEYKEETHMGIYNDLAVDLELKIKFGGFKSSQIMLVQCRRLKVPLISNSESSPTKKTLIATTKMPCLVTKFWY